MEPLYFGNLRPESFRISTDQYDPIAMLGIKWGDGPAVHVGGFGRCRYCGEDSPSQLPRAHAHVIPNFLGNSRAYSDDECRSCNQVFGRYDSELANLVGPFLTIGGVAGKKGVPTQKGQDLTIRSWPTTGPSGSARALFVSISEGRAWSGARILPDGRIQVEFPFPKSSFRPRRAYKALVKCAVSILPHEELENFIGLRSWLLCPDDVEDFPVLEVALHLAQPENPFPATTATLLRRNNATDRTPYMLFAITSGAIGFVIDLMSDSRDDHIGYVRMGTYHYTPNVSISGDENSAPIEIEWPLAKRMNFSETEKTYNPISGLWKTIRILPPQPFDYPIYTTLDRFFGS